MISMFLLQLLLTNHQYKKNLKNFIGHTEYLEQNFNGKASYDDD